MTNPSRREQAIKLANELFALIGENSPIFEVSKADFTNAIEAALDRQEARVQFLEEENAGLKQREAKKASYKFSLEERLGQEYRRAEGLREGVERLYQTLQHHPPPAHENGIEYCQAWQSFQTEICGQLRAFLDALPDCRYVWDGIHAKSQR